MPPFIQIKTDVAKYTRRLRQLQGAHAQAQVATVNAVATAVHNKSGRNLQSKMILRNQYTMRSLKLSKARVRSSGAAGYAEVGSISPYLPLQETGGTRRPVRGSRVPVPTRAARGGNWRRPILRRFTIRKGTAVGRPGGHGKSPFFILRPGRNPERGNVRHTMKRYRETGKGPRYGAYRLMAPAIFTRQGGKLIKVRYLNEPSYRVKGTKWHTSAVKQFGQRRVMQQVFIREAKKRLGLIR